MSGFTLNSVTLSGTLTRDPDVRTTPGGTEVCKLRIAVNGRKKNNSTGEWEDVPNFFNVTLFGGLGAWLGNNIKKGQDIAVLGELRWHEWTTDDGGKREAVEVIANSIMPRGKSNGGGSSSSSSYDDSDIPADTSGLPPVGATASTAVNPADDDDIPF